MMIKILDDMYSYIHIIFGFVSILLGISIESTLIFATFQLIDEDTVYEKLGDIIEFSIGVVAGAFTKLLII